MKIKLVVSGKDLIGSKYPKWYGFAYRRWDIGYTVFYIIPLNLIVRYALKIYWFFYRWIKAGGWRDRLDDAYWRGYNDGNTTREHHFDKIAQIIMGKES